MKFIAKEWLKSKKATSLLIVYLVFRTIYSVIDARLIMLITDTVNDPTNITSHLWVLGIVSLIEIVICTGLEYIPPIARNNCFTSLNNRHVDKITSADFEMFTKYSCSRIWNAGEFMWEIISIGFQVVHMITLAISIVVLLVSMYMVAGNIVIPVILIYAASIFGFKKLYTTFEKNAKKIKKIVQARNQEMENCINGFAEVRSFNTAKKHNESLHDKNGQILKLHIGRAKLRSVIYGSMEGLEKLGMFVTIFFSMSLIQSGELDPSKAMALIMYVIKLLPPLINILDFVDEFSDHMKLKEDFEKIQYYVNHHECDGTIVLNSFEESIKLENVSFSYSDTSKAVNNVSLEIKKGQRIGICGVSGGGKSTLFKLINRFYKVDSGRILIDGVNIEKITRDSYYRHIGSVHQENTIFPGTIRENIVYGTSTYLEAELIEACKKACIYDFVMSLPDKFDTIVGPRGLTLSGGQRQRIALARLFMRDPEVILLDEATAALDNESETLIQNAIDNLRNKTIITIAHRLSTIKNCDVIYVIGSQGVIEYGTHETLMAQKGAYFHMNK